jgi:hypothetical protein
LEASSAGLATSSFRSLVDEARVAFVSSGVVF